MVCADDASDAVVIAHMHPNVIIVESPNLIGSRSSGSRGRAAVMETDSAILRVDPDIRILHGAGISSADDVYDVIAAGAQATGSSSAIFDADDPPSMLEAMIKAVRAAWDETHPSGSDQE